MNNIFLSCKSELYGWEAIHLLRSQMRVSVQKISYSIKVYLGSWYDFTNRGGGHNSRKLRECTSLDAPKQNNVNTAKRCTETTAVIFARFSALGEKTAGAISWLGGTWWFWSFSSFLEHVPWLGLYSPSASITTSQGTGSKNDEKYQNHYVHHGD